MEWNRMNGKLNDISSAHENKKYVSLYSLYFITVKRHYICSFIEDSEVVFVFERNDAGLKKLSQVLSEQTSDSSALINAMCLLKYVLNCEQHFSYFHLDYPTSGLIVTGLARLYRKSPFYCHDRTKHINTFYGQCTDLPSCLSKWCIQCMLLCSESLTSETKPVTIH
jgi:hypothetical protein